MKKRIVISGLVVLLSMAMLGIIGLAVENSLKAQGGAGTEGEPKKIDYKKIERGVKDVISIIKGLKKKEDLAKLQEYCDRFTTEELLALHNEFAKMEDIYGEQGCFVMQNYVIHRWETDENLSGSDIVTKVIEIISNSEFEDRMRAGYVYLIDNDILSKSRGKYGTSKIDRYTVTEEERNRIMDILIELVKDKSNSPKLRTAAIRTMGHGRRGKDIQLIFQILDDPNEDRKVREGAINGARRNPDEALRKRGDEEWDKIVKERRRARELED